MSPIFFSILTKILIITVVSSLLKYLFNASSTEESTSQNGFRNLRANKAIKYLGYISLVITTIIVVGDLLTTKNIHAKDILMVSLFYTVFASMASYLLMYYKNTKVSFNEEIVMSTNFRGKSKAIKWADVISVDFDLGSRWIILKSKSETIRLATMLNGFSELTMAMKKHIPENLTKVAFEKMARLK